MNNLSKKTNATPMLKKSKANSSKATSSKDFSSQATIKNPKKNKRQIKEVDASDSDKTDSDYAEYLKTYYFKEDSLELDQEHSQVTLELNVKTLPRRRSLKLGLVRFRAIM
jgi:hypothetical protein